MVGFMTLKVARAGEALYAFDGVLLSDLVSSTLALTFSF